MLSHVHQWIIRRKGQTEWERTSSLVINSVIKHSQRNWRRDLIRTQLVNYSQLFILKVETYWDGFACVSVRFSNKSQKYASMTKEKVICWLDFHIERSRRINEATTWRGESVGLFYRTSREELPSERKSCDGTDDSVINKSLKSDRISIDLDIYLILDIALTSQLRREQCCWRWVIWVLTSRWVLIS